MSSPPDEVPPEIALGACIEVWAPDGKSVFDAWRRHSRARHRWKEGSGMSTAELCRRVPAGAPWSVDYCLEHGPGEWLQQRLDRAGVTLADLPALREAAARWPVDSPDHHNNRIPTRLRRRSDDDDDRHH